MGRAEAKKPVYSIFFARATAGGRTPHTHALLHLPHTLHAILAIQWHVSAQVLLLHPVAPPALHPKNDHFVERWQPCTASRTRPSPSPSRRAVTTWRCRRRRRPSQRTATRTRVALPNLPISRCRHSSSTPRPPCSDMHLENLARNGTVLKGTLTMHNLPTHVVVVVRFLLDNWQTTPEVSVEHAISPA
jgi:hypothetical protein